MKEKKRRRYPGVTPFSTDQADIFFGRGKERDELFKLISREKLVILFGKSGYGKSSLLNAAVIPMLEKGDERKRFIPVLVRLGNYVEGKSVHPTVATREFLKKKLPLVLDPLVWQSIFPEINLWDEMKIRQPLPDKTGKEAIVLLIFDQFEEFFLYPSEWQSGFREQLSELIYQDAPQKVLEKLEEIPEDLRTQIDLPLDIRVLFSTRSDRLSLFDTMKVEFPSIFRNRFELRGLTLSQAQEAIEGPAQLQDNEFESMPFTYANESINRILIDLSERQKYIPISIFLEERYVEAFQLQVLCQRIEQNVIEEQIKGTKNIRVEGELLPEFAEVYEKYYTDRIKTLEDPIQEKIARFLIEEELVSVNANGEGRRIPVDKDTLADSMLAKHGMEVEQTLLDNLVSAFLLRPEINSTGGTSYEICHDTLLSSVLKFRKERRAEEEGIKKALDEKLKKEQREMLEQERKMKYELYSSDTNTKRIDIKSSFRTSSPFGLPSQLTISEIDWRSLMSAMEAGRIALILGPDVLLTNGHTTAKAISERLIAEEGIVHRYWPNVNLYDFKDHRSKMFAVRRIRKFYEEIPRDSQVYEKIAKIPINMIFSLNIDSFIVQTYERLGIPYSFDFFDKNRSSEFKMPNIKNPFVYNLIGSLDSLDSILLSPSDVNDYFKTFFYRDGLNFEFYRELERVDLIIIYGLQTHNWYLSFLLQQLFRHSYSHPEVLWVTDEMDQFHEVPLSFNATFVPQQAEFLDKLFNMCQENNILRKVLSEDQSPYEKIEHLIKIGDIEAALQALSAIPMNKQDDMDSVAILHAKYQILQEAKSSGTIDTQTENVEWNRIRLHIFDLLKDINQ